MPQHHAIDQFHSYTDTLLEEAGSIPATVTQTAPAETWRQRWRSPQVALASLGFLVFGNIGVAAASNSAVPGDLLYPVDLAFESVAGLVGFDVGGATERLEEASVLIARGQFDAAIDPIAYAAAELDDQAAASITALADHLTDIGSESTDREALHRATFALVETVRASLVDASDVDLATWKQAVADRVQLVADTANGRPFTPPGQDDNFVPPGQDDNFVPPGQDDGSTPPGLEGKPVPPGQDDNFVPPGQQIEPTPEEDSPPPREGDEFTPPGRDDNFTPPGRAKPKPKGQGHGS